MQQSPALIYVQLYHPQLDKQRIVASPDSNFILDVSWNSHLQMDWNTVINLLKKPKKIVGFKHCQHYYIIIKNAINHPAFMKNILNIFLLGK